MKPKNVVLQLAGIALISIPLTACNTMQDMWGDPRDTANYDYYRNAPKASVSTNDVKAHAKGQVRQQQAAAVEPSTTTTVPKAANTTTHSTKQVKPNDGPMVPGNAPSVVN